MRGLVVAVGFVVAVGSAAFLVRGLMGGIGVVTVFGLVVVGSAAFLVRWQLAPERQMGIVLGALVVVDRRGELYVSAPAEPDATIPPAIDARANAAAMMGRRFVTRTD